MDRHCADHDHHDGHHGVGRGCPDDHHGVGHVSDRCFVDRAFRHGHCVCYDQIVIHLLEAGDRRHLDVCCSYV